MRPKKLLEKIRNLLNVPLQIKKVFRELRDLKYTIRHDWLIDKALNCTEKGVTEEALCEHEVVVSLTTYGKRLYDVAVTIESIMQGSMKPNRIILWLGEDMRNTILPIALKRQQARGLEISFCKDIRSYTKLIPTLKKCPDSVIITIDDDVIYHYDVIEKLVNTHISNPKQIIANRIHRIVLDENGRPVSYKKWKLGFNTTEESKLNFFTGVGGVLYPPHSLHPEVFNENVFLEICKYADDVWFNAMALKEGAKVLKCYTHDERGEDYLRNERVQDIALRHINKGGTCENDKQLKEVFDKYDLWKELI